MRRNRAMPFYGEEMSWEGGGNPVRFDESKFDENKSVPQQDLVLTISTTLF